MFKYISQVLFIIQMVCASLFKDIVTIPLTFSEFLLLLIRQMMNFHAGCRATIIHFFFARLTLYKEQMTGIVGTVGMQIGRGSTLVAMCNHIVRNSFCPTLIKHKILSNKFIFKTFFIDLSHIIDDATFQLKHIFKTFMF